MRSPIRAEVSAAALRHNLARIREVAPRSRVMAVVKANAYGHGLVETARCLQDADAFGVARLDEALQLRNAAIRRPIVLLEGVLNAQAQAEAAQHDVELVLHCEEQIRLLEQANAGEAFIIWLKIDTGMNRLGLRADQVDAALARLQAMGPKVRELRLMTHFASADETDADVTRQQIQRFAALTSRHDCPRSLCNSAGAFSQPDAHADWIRPGLALYGVSPFAELLGRQLGLQPAMHLESTVLAVRDVLRGECVGYGGTWRAPRDSRIAIIGAGYGDGLPRDLPSGTPVLLQGERALTVGRVSMDMLAVDVTRLPQVRVGNLARLWGDGLPIEEIAAHAGTIPYELLCGVNRRVSVTLT